MFARRALTAVLAVVAVLAACGDEVSSPATSTDPETTVAETTTTTTIPPVTTTTPTTIPPATTTTTSTTTTSTTTTTTATTSTTTTTTEPPLPTIAPGMTQPAVWPGPGTTFDTPEAAATDFIERAFGVEALLGEFMYGDSMSGEIEVLSPLDDDDPATTAPTGVLLELRRIVPDGGWFVLGASSEGVTIEQPAAQATVPAGPLVVSGLGRGFEGTVVVRAFPAGDRWAEFDFEIAGTAWQTPVPYSVTLDLTAARPGDMVAIVAVGDTGIAATGEFAAIAVMIG